MKLTQKSQQQGLGIGAAERTGELEGWCEGRVVDSALPLPTPALLSLVWLFLSCTLLINQ